MNNVEKKQHGGEMNHAEIDRLWEESQKNFVLRELLAGKDLQAVIECLPGFEEAFEKELDTVVCSDERVPAGEGIKAGFAGQLILLPEADLIKFIDDYLWHFKTITSHDNCGAAEVKYKEILKSGDLPPGINSSDDLGKWHSERLIRLINNRRKDVDSKRAEKEKVSYRHIPQSEMTGEVHNARAICFDGTGHFNPEAIRDMPEAYVCSGPGFGLSREYNISELNILTNIALGNHGFDGKFTPEDPFYIFVSTYSQDKLDEFMEWANEAVSEFGDRVEVKGFIAPAPESDK